MYYYAMIDDSNIVTNTLSAGSPISAPTMIPITEEQYNAGDLIGKYYDSSTGEFVDPTPSVLAAHSTAEINHGEEWLSDIITKLTKKPKRHTATTMTKVTNHGISERIGSMAYGNGVYILAPNYHQVYTSTDLVTFTLRETGATGSIFKVLFHNGYFFAATSKGEILKSADGITWTKKTITLAEGVYLPYQLVATAGKIATVASDGKFYLSTDMGETWTNVYTSDKYTALSYIGNEFILYGGEAGETKNTVNTAITTGNGTTWVTDYTYYDYDKVLPGSLDIESNGDYLVGIATGSSIYTSKDGISWVKEQTHKGDHLHMCEFTGDIAYVGVHRGYLYYNDQKCIHDWSMVKLDTTAYIDVAAELNGKFIVTTLDNELFIDDVYETSEV